MHQPFRARAVMLALLLVLPIGAASAACAADDPDPIADAIEADVASATARDPRLDEALDRVVASPTGRFHYETEIALGTDPTGIVEPGTAVSDVVRGAFDRAAGRVAIWSGPGAHADQLRSESPEGARMAEGSDFVVDGLAIFWRHPFSSEVLGIEGWIGGLGVDAATVAELTEDPAVGFDPAAVAELLRGAGPLEREGEGDVRGVRAERYRTVVHLDRVLDHVSADRQDAVSVHVDDITAAVEEFGASPDDRTLDGWVWLTDDGDLVRLELEVPVADGVFGEGASMRAVLDLYDYGAPVAIEVPDRSQVQPPPGL